MADLSRLQDLAADDASLVTLLLEMFSDQSVEFVEELKAALSARNPQDSKTIAHTFKGVCLNLGLDDIAKLCKEIEDTALSQNFDTAQTTFANLQEEVEQTLPLLEDFKASL